MDQARILPKTTYEQRSSLYEDVETLLDFGFLTVDVLVNGVRLSLRSLGPGDRFVLRHRIHKASTEEWRAWAIASSVWLIDGYTLLDNPNSAPSLFKTFLRLPNNVKAILFNGVMGLFNRVSKAIDAVESYAYEKISRYKWKSLGKMPFTTHYGASLGNMGTNHVQRMWTFYNQIEDQKIADDHLWEGFKLVTSAQAPKGVKKIDDRDRQTRKQEEERRQATQDKFYYIAKGVLKSDADKKNEAMNQGMMLGVKSADDLVDEMKRWVTGEFDWHDEIVDNYKRTVAEGYARHKQEAAERKAMMDALWEQESGVPKAMVAYTPEQLAEILKDRQPGPGGVRQVGSGAGIVREHLYAKYLERQPDSGSIRVDEEGHLTVAANSPERPPLDQRVAERQVAFRVGNDEEDPLPNEW